MSARETRHSCTVAKADSHVGVSLALTYSHKALFIARRLRRSFLGNADGVQGIFGATGCV